MSATITQFDHYLSDSGPAALVIRESLMPVEGNEGVLFPSTYAKTQDGTFAGGYNINEFKDGENVVLIDSVGSQSNRIEPIFAEGAYSHLVPQITIKAGNVKSINLLQAGHRAGDAIVRASELQDELHSAFEAFQDGDATALAKTAPTSLVFGVWDSRDTQAKSPRLIASTIRAYNVKKLTRSATYVAPFDYAKIEVFSDEDRQKAEGDQSNPLSKGGFVNALASNTHGGVIATGGIRRDATLALAALRLLHAGSNTEATLKLRRYILGLALVAFTRLPSGYLRQGTILVLDPEPKTPNEFVEVLPTGKRNPAAISHEQALLYATEAANAFGVATPRTVEFETKRAKANLEKAKGDKAGDKDKAAKKAKGAKAAAAISAEDAPDA
jgi:CRISPR-associated protein Csb1